ncbi:hypothetical protein EDD17DRAFT_1503688 [Pisolithus thermaeus]|nr:hypothetical protein EDD17DRAFT_1503688 [Pisolithus thermaeus]
MLAHRLSFFISLSTPILILLSPLSSSPPWALLFIQWHRPSHPLWGSCEHMMSPATSNLPIINPWPTATSPSSKGTGSLPIINTWPTAASPSRSSFSTEVLPPLSEEASNLHTPTPPMAGSMDTIHLSWCSVCESEVFDTYQDASVLSLHAALQGRHLPPVLSEGCSWTCLDGDPFIHSVPGQYIVVWASNYGSGGQSMPTSVGWLIIQTCCVGQQLQFWGLVYAY